MIKKIENLSEKAPPPKVEGFQMSFSDLSETLEIDRKLLNLEHFGNPLGS